MSALPTKVPADLNPLDANGMVKPDWQRFFAGLEKNPQAAAIAALSGASTTAQIATAVNAILALLTANNL